MTKLRVTYVFEYDTLTEEDEFIYGTEDPVAMAKIDQHTFKEDPEAWFQLASDYVDDASVSITVEPVE